MRSGAAILWGNDMNLLNRLLLIRRVAAFTLSTLLFMGYSAMAADGAGVASPVSLVIEADQPVAKVSPTFYGMMTEEINHSYDGGLYAELVQNRVFKDDAKTPVHWSVVQAGGGAATIALDTDQPLNTNLPVSLRLDVATASDSAPAGVANEGYWGIPVTGGNIRCG